MDYINSSGLRFTDTFLQLFCEKNSNGTKKLRLKGNELFQRFKERLFPADIRFICDFLKNHSEITELDLSYNHLEDEGLETLCHITFKHPNNLHHLTLHCCDISNLGIKTFHFVAEEKFIKLKTLRLTGNKIGPIGGQLMALTIPLLPDLEYLDLGDTDQTVDSVEYIFQKLYESPVKILDISRLIPGTSLQVVNDSFLAESMSQLFRLNQALVEFHAQKCNLDAHDVEILVTGLKGNSSLRFLDVGNNRIGCPGLEFIADWLKQRPKLLGLNVSANGIGDHGAIGLSYGLVFSKIRYLDVSYNKIGDKGMIAILGTVKKVYMLRYFLVWGNLFGQATNEILYRMMLSKVFEQDRIDVKVYKVDGVLKVARFGVDKYKHRYYGVTDFGCATELKIKRNLVENVDDKPKALVDFKHIDRFPAIEKN